MKAEWRLVVFVRQDSERGNRKRYLQKEKGNESAGLSGKAGKTRKGGVCVVPDTLSPYEKTIYLVFNPVKKRGVAHSFADPTGLFLIR